MHEPDSLSRPPGWRSLAAAYMALALLAAAAALLPRFGGVTLGIAIVLLAVPAMLALWHRGAVRRLERLHRFAPGRWLHRFGARRVLGQVAGAVVACALSAAVLLQSPWFDALEWTLLAAAPLVHFVWVRIARARAASLYSRPVYATAAAGQLARWATFATLCVVWLASRLVVAGPSGLPVAEVAYGLQSSSPNAASAIVAWAVDAGAWGQAIAATLGSAATVPWWRAVLALVVLPATVFGYATWTAAGAALDATQWRLVFGGSLSEADVPQAVGARRVRAYALAGATGAAVAVAAFAVADAGLAREERWFALRAVPYCERIGGAAYAVGTLARLEAYHATLESGIADAKRNGCQRIVELQRVLAVQVDAYLDWYFSFGADLTQTVLLATGEVEALAEFKLNRLIASDPQVATLLGQLDGDQEYIRLVSARAASGLEGVLDQQRLVLDERQCRVVQTETMQAAQWRWRGEGLQTRLPASGMGAVVGGFAGALAGRAMGRASMKAAQRVLGKAAGKVATRIGGGAVAGGAVGSVGAVPGAVVGGILGAAAAAVGIDFAMLKAEEALTREGMRRDLLATVDETLAPLKAAFGCPGS